MSTHNARRTFPVAAPLALAAALAVTLAAEPAFAGKPVFERKKPHVNVGSTAPMGFASRRPPHPPVPIGFRPTMIFSQPRSAATSGAEYKYVSVRRTASGVAMEKLELVHEGFIRPHQGAMPRIRFSNNLHGPTGIWVRGGHVKVFDGRSR